MPRPDIDDPILKASLFPNLSGAARTAAQAAATDADVGGQICPAGGYCEQGSAWPKYCQGGKYNPQKGKKTVFDCTLCLPGKYCAGSGGGTPTGDCKNGYYCTSGSAVEDQNPAPPGSISNIDTKWKATKVCL